MSLKSKVFGFLNRVVVVKSQTTNQDVIKYDVDNLFPQNLIRQISESGTATACIDILNEYIYAYGLVDEEIGNVKINETQTINQLIKKTVSQISNFQALSWYITRTGDGKIAEIKNIPFEYLRKKENGEIVYNPTLSLIDKFDKKKDEIYPPFAGSVISLKDFQYNIQTYGKDKGEILYFFNEKPCQYTYPVPSYHSAISDINTDAENSKYELESVNNSFLPSGLLTFVGDIDDENEDDDGLTEWGAIQKTVGSFTGAVKDQRGDSGRQKLAVFYAKTKEELPVYQQINNEGILTAIEASTKRVAEKVSRAFGVPPFLIGLGGNVGFATNIISDNITLFNNRVKVLQDIICEALTLCFPEQKIELTQLTPIKYIAPEVYAKLSDAEIREIGGYKTDETKITTNVSLAQSLGVGSTTSLVEILKDVALTPQQKINTLVILFNISEENSKKLVDVQAISN